MLKVDPSNSKSMQSYETVQIWNGYPIATGKEMVQIFEDYVTAYSGFNAISSTTQVTTNISTPEPGGSLVLCDLIITAKKINLGVITVCFDDDTNNSVIFEQETKDSAVTFHHNFKGRWQAWQDARLDVTVSGSNVILFCAASYVKLPIGDIYAEWIDRR